MSKVKIASLELEDVKRVKAVSLEPLESGLTVIGGNNKQGKTSVLDGICAAVGGEKLCPSDPIRDGAKKAVVSVTLSNGIKAVRTFTAKGNRLVVTDELGGKGNQTLLNKFLSEFTLNVGAFINANPRKRTDTLLKVIGVDLTEIDDEIEATYDKRRDANVLNRNATAAMNELHHDPDAPEKLTDTSKLQEELQAGNDQNRLNDSIVKALEAAESAVSVSEQKILDLGEKAKAIELELQAAAKALIVNQEVLKSGQEKVEKLTEFDPAPVTKKIAEAEELNKEFYANEAYRKAAVTAQERLDDWQVLEDLHVKLVEDRKAILEGANLPLPELSVEEGQLTYKGQNWDCMSGAEQLIVSTAIGQAVKPDTGFVLIDGIEAMDLDTLNEFGEWLVSNGLQAITTRVSRGDECSIVIEDGEIA